MIQATQQHRRTRRGSSTASAGGGTRSRQRFTRSVAAAWRPPPPALAVEWVPRHVRMPTDTETPGRFDPAEFPHTMGVLEAADDPDTRVVLLPWSARLGKTIAWISLLAFYAATSPRPGMVGREDEDAVDQLLDSQVWPILEACAPLRDQLPPKRRRSSRKGIRLRRMRIRKAYSGSPGSMAGFPACYGFASELSKWSTRKSGEAAAHHLFLKRAWGFPFDSQYVLEGTPATLGSCQVTELCDQAGVDVRRRECRCPHCGTWQVLEFGDEASPAGLKWDKLPDGRSDPALAERSAWYRCTNGCRIDNEDRHELISSGVWLSDGQRVDKRGRVTGARPDVRVVAFGHPVRCPFGALYSTQVSGWGQIAREWLDKKRTREGRREFFNQVLGQVWDPAPVRVLPSQLADRLGTPEPALRIVPAWAGLLTGGMDVGRAGDLYIFYWWVSAWGAGSRGHLVDYGLDLGVEAAAARITTHAWRLEGQATAVPADAWGVDSGTFTEAVYDFCRPLPGVWPVKSSSRDSEQPFTRGDFPEMIRGGYQRAGVPDEVLRAKQKAHAFDLLMLNTSRTQGWVEERLQGFVKPDDPAWYSIPRAALTADPLPGIHLPTQLLGDYEDERGRWQKRTAAQDFRDAWRISQGVAWLLTANGQAWDEVRPITGKRRSSSAVINAGEGRPGGRPW